jgi:hypothetical protein
MPVATKQVEIVTGFDPVAGEFWASVHIPVPGRRLPERIRACGPLPNMALDRLRHLAHIDVSPQMERARPQGTKSADQWEIMDGLNFSLDDPLTLADSKAKKTASRRLRALVCYMADATPRDGTTMALIDDPRWESLQLYSWPVAAQGRVVFAVRPFGSWGKVYASEEFPAGLAAMAQDRLNNRVYRPEFSDEEIQEGRRALEVFRRMSR